jgi:hypothetical protein
MGEHRPQDAILLRRSYYTRNVGIIVGVLTCIVAFANLGDRRLPLVLAMGIVASTLVLLGARGFLRRLPASVDANGVRVGEKVVLDTKSIASAWVERTYDVAIVHLARPWRAPIELETSDAAEAHALLATLFGEPGPPLSEFVSTSPWIPLAAAALGQLVGLALLGHAAPSMRIVCLALAALVCALLFYGRGRVAVGADGVLLSGLLHRQFLAFTDVASAMSADDRWPSSRKLVLMTQAQEAIARWMRAPEADAAAERIQASLTARDARPRSLGLPLRRDGADAQGWLARLRSLDQSGPYRATAAPGQSLWRLINDPGAAETERAAAAVVLGAEANSENRSRLREVAARIASPRVRVAIECAAAGASEEVLVAAMAPLEDSA